MIIKAPRRQKRKRRNFMATFTNRATLSYNGRTTDSNIVTGTINETLTIQKTVLENTYADGTRLTYIVSLINSGVTAFTGLTVNDDLGGYLFDGNTIYPLAYVDGSAAYYVNGIPGPAPTVTAGPPLSITGIGVPAGGNVLIIYQADVTDFAPLDIEGEITNTATASGGGLNTPISDQETVITSDEANLSITKSLTPLVVSENGSVTYTFDIRNTGNTGALATDDVVVTDTFDPILSITSVTLNGVALTEGTDYTYNAVTGEFATVAGVITVPAATYERQPDGTFAILPGTATLVVSGTV